MNNSQVIDLLRLSRAYCAERLVWFAPALYQARIVVTDHVEVAAIDRHMNTYFNPKAIEEICRTSPNKLDQLSQIGFLWIHEISHVLRFHADRAIERNANAKLWNIATDLEINDAVWQDLIMPKAFPGVVPGNFKLPTGKLAEWYFQAISDNPDVLENGMKVQMSDEGSGVHGQMREWEQDGQEISSETEGETPGRQELHALDLELVRRAVAQKMAENRKYMGSLPGMWEVWVEEVLRSRIDWKKKLRHRMSIAMVTGMGARVDYTFSKPNRRQSVYFPVIAPAFSGDMSARIACVVDTSGSMGGEELGCAVGEVCKVLEDFKVPVTVIPCDAQAYEPIVIRSQSDYIKVSKLKGGGGTDMIVGIEAALALRPVPDSILVITDGYTPYPQNPYKTPVVFGILKRNYNDQTLGPPSPPWSKEAIVDIVI